MRLYNLFRQSPNLLSSYVLKVAITECLMCIWTMVRPKKVKVANRQTLFALLKQYLIRSVVDWKHTENYGSTTSRTGCSISCSCRCGDSNISRWHYRQSRKWIEDWNLVKEIRDKQCNAIHLHFIWCVWLIRMPRVARNHRTVNGIIGSFLEYKTSLDRQRSNKWCFSRSRLIGNITGLKVADGEILSQYIGSGPPERKLISITNKRA